MSESPIETPAPYEPEKPKRNLAPFIVGAIAILGFGYFGKEWLEGRHYEGTDDAYVTADIVQLSAEVKGAVLDVKPKINSEVKSGDEIAQIDPTEYEAALQQAEANFAMAQAQAQSAGATIQLTKSQGAADLQGARGGELAAGGGVGSALAQVGVLQAQLASAEQTAEVAKIEASNLDKDIETARDTFEKSKSAINAARSAVNAAKAAADAAQSSIAIAQANRDWTSKQYERANSLFAQGAVAAKERDLASANLAAADGTVAQAKAQALAAQAAVAQRESELQSAELASKAAQSAMVQAGMHRQQGSVHIQSALSQIQSQRSSLAAARQAVTSAEGALNQAHAGLTSANTLPQKLQEKEAQRALALAQVKQAEAAVAAAKLNLKRTHIHAPVSGFVSKKYALPGNLLVVGSPIMSLVPSGNLYVVANFKETQIARMHAGQKVEIDIDGFPGHPFHGEVESLSAATGSQFALIPPDNATGNFVKVVQRLPVKVRIEPDDQTAKLAAGMSVGVKVRVD